MGWHAQLALDYTLQSGRVVAKFAHTGPLRILQSLYPEGDGVCHNVLVHPPGGLVGGDTLDLRVRAASGAHGLLTTPGATRFYRSDGAAALQRSHLALAADARLEWLPQEALCYSGCVAHNEVRMELAPGAELLGWDVTALGLPHAGKPFVAGSFTQHLEIPGVWLERGHLAATDLRLLQGRAGLAGMQCLASVFFASGTALARARRQQGLDCARALLQDHPLAAYAGVTSPNPQLLVLRVLTPLVEPAMALLRQVRSAWRDALWQRPACDPRVWAM